jgi:hypothetical protein
VPALSDVVVTSFSPLPFSVLTGNGNLWVVPLLHSVSDLREQTGWATEGRAARVMCSGSKHVQCSAVQCSPFSV